MGTRWRMDDERYKGMSRRKAMTMDDTDTQTAGFAIFEFVSAPLLVPSP